MLTKGTVTLFVTEYANLCHKYGLEIDWGYNGLTVAEGVDYYMSKRLLEEGYALVNEMAEEQRIAQIKAKWQEDWLKRQDDLLLKLLSEDKEVPDELLTERQILLKQAYYKSRGTQ